MDPERWKQVDDLLEAALDRLWSCPDCGTRVWHKGTPEASRCKCGKRVFPPPPAP